MTDKMKKMVREFNPKKVRIGVLGSHSALEIASGAKQEKFETVVVCEKGREKTYTKYYKGLFDHVILLDKFADITGAGAVKKLNSLNTVFVPNRSFAVYAGYESIEQKFAVPLMGNRYMLRTEERNTPKNQLYLLKKAGILTPKVIKSPDEIDRLAIVKVTERPAAGARLFLRLIARGIREGVEEAPQEGRHRREGPEARHHRGVRARR